MERRRPIMKLLHPAALFLTFVLTAGSAVAFAAPDLTEALKKTVAVQLPIFINSIKRIPPYYVHPDFYRMKSHGSLLLLSHYRTHQQETEYTCGPAAALTVADYYLGKSPHSEMEIARIMETHPWGMEDVGTNTRGWCVILPVWAGRSILPSRMVPRKPMRPLWPL